MAIARQRRFLIGIEGGDQAAACHIGVLGQETDQRQGRQRCRDHQILILLELKSNLDGDFGQLFEFDGIDRRNAHDLPSHVYLNGFGQ